MIINITFEIIKLYEANIKLIMNVYKCLFIT